MEINVGKYRLSQDGPSYVVSRVSKARSTGEESQTNYAYYALLDRLLGENLRADRPEVTTLRDLIAVVEDARVAVVEAVGDRTSA